MFANREINRPLGSRRRGAALSRKGALLALARSVCTARELDRDLDQRIRDVLGAIGDTGGEILSSAEAVDALRKKILPESWLDVMLLGPRYGCHLWPSGGAKGDVYTALAWFQSAACLAALLRALADMT